MKIANLQALNVAQSCFQLLFSLVWVLVKRLISIFGHRLNSLGTTGLLVQGFSTGGPLRYCVGSLSDHAHVVIRKVKVLFFASRLVTFFTMGMFALDYCVVIMDL